MSVVKTIGKPRRFIKYMKGKSNKNKHAFLLPNKL